MLARLLWTFMMALFVTQAVACSFGGHWGVVDSSDTTPSTSGGSGGEPPYGGAGGAPSCEADCVSLPRWLGPSLFTFGPSGDLPACPADVAPNPGVELFDGLSAPPLDCPVCQCEDSETACSVPTGWHASAAKCADAESAWQTPFPAPAGWSGACASDNAVPPGALCGGVACVQSVTVESPQVIAAKCAPEAIGGGAPPPVTWATRARECLPEVPAACPEAPPACRPPPGFSLCVYRGGDVPCEEPYLERHLFHRTHEDHRACSPCDCGPPAGNACITFVTAYTDQGCGAVAGAIHVASGESGGCFDLPAGFPLSAKTAEVIAAFPGSCDPSGGDPGGDAFPVLPVTVCCREEQVPE